MKKTLYRIILLVLTIPFLSSCSNPEVPKTSTATSVEFFKATPETVIKGSNVTLTWKATNVGTVNGQEQCVLVRDLKGPGEIEKQNVSCEDMYEENISDEARFTFLALKNDGSGDSISRSIVIIPQDPAQPKNSDWTPVKKTDAKGTVMLKVPTGSFALGTEFMEDIIRDGVFIGDVFLDSRPVNSQTIKEVFWIDETEVTRSAYKQCVTEGTCVDKQKDTDLDWPIANVSWQEANTYCTWRGARLPSEVEWEFAAKGPDDLTYPWGNEFKEGYAHNSREPFLRPVRVGSFPKGISWVGALDMAGNIEEWTNSYFEFYPYRSENEIQGTIREDNILGATSRGGSYLGSETDIRTYSRTNGSGQTDFGILPSLDSQGFRCAKFDREF